MARKRVRESYFNDDARRSIIPLLSEYSDGQLVGRHSHRRHQLLLGSAGSIIVETDQATWVMPAHRALWIPAKVSHSLRIVGATSVSSLYFEPSSARKMPTDCQVLGTSQFVRELIGEAIKVPKDGQLDLRARALLKLLAIEVRTLPCLPLSLQLPRNRRLADKCRHFLRQPTSLSSPNSWSRDLHLSLRTFARLFQRETGMSFMQWRQQACLLAAIPRLAAGESVTRIASDLGYSNPTAFTSMFKRALGLPPRAYMLRDGHERPKGS